MVLFKIRFRQANQVKVGQFWGGITVIQAYYHTHPRTDLDQSSTVHVMSIESAWLCNMNNLVWIHFFWVSRPNSGEGTRVSFVKTAAELPYIARDWVARAWDSLSWILALATIFVLRYDLSILLSRLNVLAIYLVTSIILYLVLQWLYRSFRGRYRIGSFYDAMSVATVVMIVAVVTGIGGSQLSPPVPFGVVLMVPLLTLVFILGGRGFWRILLERSHCVETPQQVPILVYGTGDLGHEIARLVDRSADRPYKIVGFIDDNPQKRRLRIGRNHKVLGRGSDIVKLAQVSGAQMVVVAIAAPPIGFMRDLSTRCAVAGIKVSVVPDTRALVQGHTSLTDLRQMEVTDILQRHIIKTDIISIADYLNGKVVLVTGAGGSIGSELARQLHNLGPSKLVLLDRDESALHSVSLSIWGSGLLDTDDTVLCDIRDEEALLAIFQHHRPDVVFHAAALKHLPMLERFPEEGWKTNVLGTLNVLKCAHAVGVETLVNISTDKAADATSVLGRTKRLAERLTGWFAMTYNLTYLSVRFGNVFGSRGSVLATFQAQIAQGGPVTVTHPQVTRFFMTIPEACQLVLQAGAIGHPADVMVLDMGEPVKIIDVAKYMIGQSGKSIDIRFTGLRPGEKLHEVLFSEQEESKPSGHSLIRRVTVPPLNPEKLLDEHPQSEGAEPTLYLVRDAIAVSW